MGDPRTTVGYTDEDVVEASIETFGTILKVGRERALIPRDERMLAMQIASQIAGTALSIGPSSPDKVEAWRASILAFLAAHDAEALEIAVNKLQANGVSDEALGPLRIALNAKQRTAEDLRIRLHEITGRPSNG